MLKWIVFIVAATVALGHVNGQEKKEDIGTWISKSIDSVITKFKVPGIAVGVVEHGRVAYRQGFGFASLATRKPMTTETIFHTASVTKTFVATAVMQLVEQGKVNLDSSVYKYVPYFQLKDLRYQKITVRQMLTHSSGMPDVEDYEWDKPQYDEKALERYVKNISVDTLLFSPGAQFSYSNMAYEILGDLVSKAAHAAFEDYVSKYILTPLKMKNSTLFFPAVDTANLAAPYLSNDAGQVELSPFQPYNRSHAPSSTLYSNIDDMNKWIIANLNRGNLNGVHILSNVSYSALWNPSVPMGSLPPYGNAFVGLSWFQVKPGLIKYVLHSGYDKGYQAFIALAPDKSAGIVLLANLSSYNYDLTSLGINILEHLLRK
jgi:CubicO group peptidase (beta-lactamase class C family)